MFSEKGCIVRPSKLRTKFGEILCPAQRLYPLEVQFDSYGFSWRNIKCAYYRKTPDKDSSDYVEVEDNFPRLSTYGRVIRTPERLDRKTVVETQNNIELPGRPEIQDVVGFQFQR